MGGRGRGEWNILSDLAVAGIFVGSLMLLHVVFAGEGLVTCRADHRFLSRVFLAVASSVAGSGECVGAAEATGMRAREFLFGRARCSSGGGARVVWVLAVWEPDLAFVGESLEAVVVGLAG